MSLPVSALLQMILSGSIQVVRTLQQLNIPLEAYTTMLLKAKSEGRGLNKNDVQVLLDMQAKAIADAEQALAEKKVRDAAFPIAGAPAVPVASAEEELFLDDLDGDLPDEEP